MNHYCNLVNGTSISSRSFCVAGTATNFYGAPLFPAKEMSLTEEYGYIPRLSHKTNDSLLKNKPFNTECDCGYKYIYLRALGYKRIVPSPPSPKYPPTSINSDAPIIQTIFQKTVQDPAPRHCLKGHDGLSKCFATFLYLKQDA